MRIIVIGGPGLPEQVAAALHKAGDEVTVIDTGAGRESALAKAGLRAVRGDSIVPSHLGVGRGHLTWESAAGTLHAGAAEAIKTVTGKAKLTPG